MKLPRFPQGVIETVVAGTKSYPASSEMGLMHTALGNGIADFLNGDKDAATTLADVEAVLPHRRQRSRPRPIGGDAGHFVDLEVAG